MPYDLATMQSNTEQNELIPCLSLPYRSGSAVSGTSKVVQQFITEMLTVRGSVRFRPDFGCSFLTDIRGRNTSSLEDLSEAVSRALHVVVENGQRRITRELPYDEIISEARLVDLTPNLDTVLASIVVYTYDRQEIPFQLPVSIDNG
jgi:hypothetical protein